ncbi:hypothetical protein HYPSUDRAFT_205753 [Hypholoma sublateritium FD-334 SS-4]|uniref:Uncharacterized protein n=1 Tax=Hypholoma sublateritium (strain FD-334 SS-4) TaxID=945553 RepID=A0A0D2NMR7_HYPSF|nr:hypothetical protein HYPSUDRAFT_205753 [Hypholoma sublateritium FD-334 SS-4]
MATITSSSNSLPAATPSAAPAAPAAPAVPPTQPRPLHREGAMFILTPEEQALELAMLRSSPAPETSALGKRTRDDDNEAHDGTDTEPDSEAPLTSQVLAPTSSNVTTASLRYATQKRIRSEQRGELDAFLLDSALGRQARIFVCLLSIENKIEAFQSATPPYQVSEELKTNINNYAVAVLLSVEISAYKGDIPRNHILASIQPSI